MPPSPAHRTRDASSISSASSVTSCPLVRAASTARRAVRAGPSSKASETSISMVPRFLPSGSSQCIPVRAATECPFFRFASPCLRGSHGKNSHPGAATLPGASPASDRVRWQDLLRGRYTIIGENRESRAGSSSRDRLAGGTQGLAASAAVPVACRAAAAEARTSTVARTSPGHGLLLAPGTMLPWRGAPDYPRRFTLQEPRLRITASTTVLRPGETCHVIASAIGAHLAEVRILLVRRLACARGSGICRGYCRKFTFRTRPAVSLRTAHLEEKGTLPGIRSRIIPRP